MAVYASPQDPLASQLVGCKSFLHLRTGEFGRIEVGGLLHQCVLMYKTLVVRQKVSEVGIASEPRSKAIGKMGLRTIDGETARRWLEPSVADNLHDRAV